MKKPERTKNLRSASLIQKFKMVFFRRYGYRRRPFYRRRSFVTSRTLNKKRAFYFKAKAGRYVKKKCAAVIRKVLPYRLGPPGISGGIIVRPVYPKYGWAQITGTRAGTDKPSITYVPQKNFAKVVSKVKQLQNPDIQTSKPEKTEVLKAAITAAVNNRK